MFDNLRNEANSSPFYEEEKVQAQPAARAATPATRHKSTKFLGMTAQQRFIIAFMLMIVICVMGTMFLLITEKIGLY